MFVSDSATEKFDLKLEGNRNLTGGQSWQTEWKMASDKHVKDSCQGGSPGQDSWHGYLHMSKYGCQAYTEIYRSAKGILELLGTMHVLVLHMTPTPPCYLVWAWTWFCGQTKLHLPLLPANAPHQETGWVLLLLL